MRRSSGYGILVFVASFLCSPAPSSSSCQCLTGPVGYYVSDETSGDCSPCFVDQVQAVSAGVLDIKIGSSISAPDGDLELSDTEDSIYPNNSVAGFCRFCSFFQDNDFATKSRVPLYENGSFMNLCGPNSEGFFCSKCKEGYHHNMASKCVKCDHLARDWVLFVLSQFLSITVFFFLLLLTNISLVSGPLNSSIFFAQMVTTTMNLDGNGLIPLANITNSAHTAHSLTATYNFLYGPWNLDFFAPFINHVCLFKHDSFLYYFVVQYAVALYPLILVGIIVLIYWINNRNATILEWCKLRLCRCPRIIPTNFYLSSRNTLASFVLLAYTKFSLLSAYLLTPNPLYNYKGDIIDWVLLYDARISYNQIAIIFAVILILLFVLLLPTVLLFFRYSNEAHFCSYLDYLLEPFQAPFKRGCDKPCCAEKRQKWKFSFKLHDYRWVPGVYFVLRILLLAIYLGTESYIVQFVFQQVVCLIAAFLFLFIQPYPRNWINKLDVFMFLLLAFINTFSIYQYYLATNARPLSKAAFAVQYILIFVPAIWIAAYTIHGIYKQVMKCKSGQLWSPHNREFGLTESASVNLKSAPKRKDYETIFSE